MGALRRAWDGYWAWQSPAKWPIVAVVYFVLLGAILSRGDYEFDATSGGSSDLDPSPAAQVAGQTRAQPPDSTVNVVPPDTTAPSSFPASTPFDGALGLGGLAPEPSGEPLLSLTEATCDATFGVTECAGYVENIGDEPLEAVVVTIAWLDAAGVAQGSDWSFIDADPLFPDQESSWTVFGPSDPNLAFFEVTFSEFLGDGIPFSDDR